MGHPDFRVRGKIFATLGHPDESCGMVSLTPQQQKEFVETQPKVFQPVAGGWGRQGATTVHLASATKSALWPALVAAWRKSAPKRLAQQFEDE